MLVTDASVSYVYTFKCSLHEDIYEGHWVVVYDKKIENRDDEHTQTLLYFWLTTLLVCNACFGGERIELHSSASRQL